jgi:hypothetical protein
VSRDGVTGWVKEATNPVLTVSSGKWDESYAGICSVLLKDSTLHAWYDGSRDPVYLNRMRIGHAWSTITSVDLERITWILPQQFAVSQNYPNPFNPSTTIQFAITRSAPTDLFIYDILGREVDHLVNEVLAPGTYKVQWDSHGVASGVYFYRLRSGEYTDTKRMLLLK